MSCIIFLLPAINTFCSSYCKYLSGQSCEAVFFLLFLLTLARNTMEMITMERGLSVELMSFEMLYVKLSIKLCGMFSTEDWIALEGLYKGRTRS